ncbi:MAG: ABC transporter substrate-binding protein [Gemmatimonadales bacterium]|nr:ABC transporter substrate-binding protein [Gemmatimonadales bacterium]
MAGPFSEPRGRSMLLAAQLAVREINAAGGVGGRQLQLEVEDDSAQTTRAIAIAVRLRDNPDVIAVVGHLTSGTTIAAADIYNSGSNPVVEISPSASNPDLTGIGRYTFRVCATDLAHGVELARFAYQKLGARNAAVLYLNDDYGRGILGTFSDEFRRLGGAIDERDPYLGSTSDFGPYLERIQRAGRAQVLMVAGDRASAAVVLRQARQRGITLPVMGGDALSGIQSEGAVAEGVYLTSNYLPDRPGGGELNAAFLRAYAAANNGEVPDHRGAGAYDAIHLIERAIRNGGTSRAAVRDALAAIDEGHPFEGVTGRIGFDDRGDVPHKGVVVGVVREGRIVPADNP